MTTPKISTGRDQRPLPSIANAIFMGIVGHLSIDLHWTDDEVLQLVRHALKATKIAKAEFAGQVEAIQAAIARRVEDEP